MVAPSSNNLRRVRTYHDDLRRATGERIPAAYVEPPEPSAPPQPHVSAPVETAAFPAPIHDGLGPKKGRLEQPPPPTMPMPLERGETFAAASPPEEATVVTDVKKRRSSFFLTLGRVFTDWWSNFGAGAPAAEERVPAEMPTPPQPAAAPAPDTDESGEEDLIARLRAHAQSQRTAPQSVQPSWTHTMPEPNAPPAAPAPAPARPTSIKRARPTIRARAPEPRRAPEPPPAPVTPPAPSPPVPATPVPEPPRIMPEPQPTATDLEAFRESRPSFLDRVREDAYERKAAQEAAQPRFAGAKRAYVIGGLVVLIVAVGAYIALTGSDEPDMPVFERPSLPFMPARTETITFIRDRSALLGELDRAVMAADGPDGALIHFALVSAQDPSETPLPARTFLDTLNLRAPGTLVRTIEDTMMLGAHISFPNAPYLVLEVRDRTDALGGMLAWEPDMTTDLAPLFGAAGQATSAPAFTDEVIDGVDARVRADQTGVVMLLYAFVDTRTLVVTTSREALRALAAALR